MLSVPPSRNRRCWCLTLNIVLAILAAVVPSITSLVVAGWYLADAVQRRVVRRRRYALEPRLKAAAEASQRRSDPALSFDARMSQLADEQERLRR